ncbi:MAG TPA: hypothetical protein VGP22_12860 [Albitalea sp.]|jgi:hypothetical protein|nr:hypothetical protein [Albitalea sp.]
MTARNIPGLLTPASCVEGVANASLQAAGRAHSAYTCSCKRMKGSPSPWPWPAAVCTASRAMAQAVSVT